MVERVLLVGMPGAGKTTVGRLVADRLGWLFSDTDASVVERTGKSVPEIFAGEGEAAFRTAETRVLHELVAGTRPTVISVAGGAVEDVGNRDLLQRSGTVVWLRASAATLTERVGDGADRPLLASGPAGTLAALDRRRRPLYEAVCTMAVDVDGRAPEEVAERVLAALGDRPSAGPGDRLPTHAGDRPSLSCGERPSPGTVSRPGHRA